MLATLNTIPVRQIQLVMWSLVALLSVALVTYLILPQLKDYKKSSQTRAVLEQAIASKDALAMQLTTEREQVSAFDKKLHGDMANLPSNQMEAYIIGRLQNISWQHKIELVGVKPSMGQEIKNFQEILFDVDVSGDYLNIYTWLGELARELGFVVIKQFEMSPVNQGKSVPVLRAKLTIASYRSVSK